MISFIQCTTNINQQNCETVSSVDEHNDKTKSDVPAWKRELLIKKEMDRYAPKSILQQELEFNLIFCRFDKPEIGTTQQSRLITAEEQKKEKFDSLPEWKKKLILQKQSKLT